MARFTRSKQILPVAALSLVGCAKHAATTAKVTLPVIPVTIERQIRNAVDAGDGDYQVHTLRTKVIAEPYNLTARLELGQLYQDRGYPELALDHFRIAADDFPYSAEAHLLKAKALRASGRTKAALEVLNSFVDAHPGPAPAVLAWLGILRDEAGDWVGGEQAHRDAIAAALEANKDQDYLHNNLGYALLMQKRKDEAAVEFRAALRLNPQSGIARDNLGVALADHPAEAIVNWQSLEGPATAHSNLAAVMIEQGKYDEARKELAVALGYNVKNQAALSNLKLLSDLDGKPAILPVVGQAVKPVPTTWSRVRSSLRIWFAGPAPQGEGSNQSASAKPE
jgi:tetratricopeptide (TPR) repeat protein